MRRSVAGPVSQGQTGKNIFGSTRNLKFYEVKEKLRYAYTAIRCSMLPWSNSCSLVELSRSCSSPSRSSPPILHSGLSAWFLPFGSFRRSPGSQCRNGVPTTSPPRPPPNHTGMPGEMPLRWASIAPIDSLAQFVRSHEPEIATIDPSSSRNGILLHVITFNRPWINCHVKRKGAPGVFY